jgi:anti-sigma B factor antagonist
MTLKSRRVGDDHVLTPTRGLVGGKETTELMAAADPIVAQGTPHIVVDLGEIDFVGSMGMSALVKIHTSCITRGGWLRLARISRRIHDALEITRLIMVFDTFDTIEEAIVGQVAQKESPPRAKEKKAAAPAAQVARDEAARTHGGEAGRTRHRS